MLNGLYGQDELHHNSQVYVVQGSDQFELNLVDRTQLSLLNDHEIWYM